LAYVGSSSFRDFKGVLTIDAGDCELLSEFGSSSFSSISNAASSVSFGKLPALRSIGSRSFYDFKGVRTITAGDCELLSEFGDFSFYGISNAAPSVSFSKLSNLTTARSKIFQSFKGTASLTGPFTSWTGPCTNLRAPGTSIYAVDEIPLTQATYAAGMKTDDITCVPDYEFLSYAGDVQLGAMPRLAYIGSNSFREFKGVLTITAGDCELLSEFGDESFGTSFWIHQQFSFFGVVLQALQPDHRRQSHFL
jgi:hypothetical protein